MHIDKHLKVLVQQNKRFVAMCEEFPRYSRLGVKEFDRRVVRVITPGTLIDEPFLNPYENNYLLAISSPVEVLPGLVAHSSKDNAIGLAWIDVSTGEFFTKTSRLDELRDELSRIAPREVVLAKELESNPSHPIHEALAEEEEFVSYISPSDAVKQSDNEEVPTSTIQSQGNRSSLPNLTSDKAVGSYPQSLNPHETSAVNLLTTYLRANLLEHMPRMSQPSREGDGGRMHIDSHTIKALEIREGSREGGTRGSLLSVIKRTVTSGGTRLLSRWLCRFFQFDFRLHSASHRCRLPKHVSY